MPRSTTRHRAPLAELHLHLYGCLRPHTLLAQLAQHEEHVDLVPYEEAYEAAFGSGSPLRDVLARHRGGDPASHAEFERLFVFGDVDAGNFARFQAKFDLILVASAARWSRRPGARITATPAALVAAEVERFTVAVLEDQRKHDIVYAEQRFFLSREVRTQDWPGIIDSIRRAIAHAQSVDGDRGTAPVMRMAPSLPRTDPWPQWEAIRDIALADGGEIITGIDFCFIEEGHPPKDKAAFFAAVREHNEKHPPRAVAVLYHVGESFTDKSLESAVRWVQQAAELGAHRLGHAIALGMDPAVFGDHTRTESSAERIDQLRYDLEHASGLERHGVRVDRGAVARELQRLEAGRRDATVTHGYDSARLAEVRSRQAFAMERVRSTGAVIEVCPTSNRRIGGILDAGHHPVHRFLDAGLRVVVASDDPGIFGVSLHDELAWVAHHAGLSDEEMEELRLNAWNSRSEVLTGREPRR